jgi:phage terminase large subunit-like protein
MDTSTVYYKPEEDLALADTMASLGEDERQAILADIDHESLLYDFNFWGRPSQLAALESDKWLTVLCAGRGYGKTRVISEVAHKKAMENPGIRIALVGRVVSDVRDVMIMGDSGILNVTPPSERPEYHSTMRRLVWPNGSEAMTFSADAANQLRGPQFHLGISDELAAWREKPDSSGLNAWANLKIATRLGDNPQIFVATTPRRVPSMIEILGMAETEPNRVKLIRGSTYANRHLARAYFDVITGMYAGTHLGMQELEGELVGDIEGALLKMETISDTRDLEAPPMLTMPIRAIGVDPSVSETPGDECGIVAVASTGEREMHKRHAWVYEDASVLGSPHVWARRAVQMAQKYQAVIVAEDNQGGALVKKVLKSEDPSIPVVLVRAKQGKALRAEPIVLAYEQGRVHHADYFGELESQYTTWVPGETIKSPDRLDAAVHGLAALLVKTPVGWAGEITLSSTASRSRIPGVTATNGIAASDARRTPGGLSRTSRGRMIPGIHNRGTIPRSGFHR